MPHTVTGASLPDDTARRNIFCSQVRSGKRSNTIRCPASARAPVHVGARLRHPLRNGAFQVPAPHLALHHVAPLAPALRPHDQQVGPPTPERVLPLDPPAAVHHPLQVRLQQQLRPRLVVLLEALHPVLGVLTKERLERRDQSLHVQGAVSVHVPRHPLRQPYLHRVVQMARHHLRVDRVGDARQAAGVLRHQPQVLNVRDVFGGPRLPVGAGQDRFDHALHPLLAQLVRQVVDMRVTAQDQPLLCLPDGCRGDRARTVAARLVAEAGVVAQRVHQPRLAGGALPDQLQRIVHERLPGLFRVLRGQGARLLLAEVAEPQRLRLDVERAAPEHQAILR